MLTTLELYTHLHRETPSFVHRVWESFNSLLRIRFTSPFDGTFPLRCFESSTVKWTSSLSSISLVKILQNSFLRRSCSGIHPFGTHSRHSIVLKERGGWFFTCDGGNMVGDPKVSGTFLWWFGAISNGKPATTNSW